MTFGEVVVALVIGVMVILVFRSVALWYWKIDALLKSLQNIERSTARATLILGEVHADAVLKADQKAAALKAALEPAYGRPRAAQ